jgi:hypothetical protein
VSRAHGVRLGGGLHARWNSARKLVSGGTPAELLDGPQGRERSSHSNHNAPVPELWVLRIVCNPAKPEWCLGLREEFEPTAISCCADWAGGPPDSTWSCSPISGEVISIRHFAELRESSSGATMSVNACGFQGTALHAEPFSYAAWGSMGTSS